MNGLKLKKIRNDPEEQDIRKIIGGRETTFEIITATIRLGGEHW